MIETYKILHGIYNCTVSPTLPRCDFVATRGNNLKLVKHYCKYDMQKYFFTQRIINLWNSLPSYVVNSCSVNILRLTSINGGIVKMFIMIINVILPELESVVTVTNSLYSTVL